jgi:signal transduction histidine kinase
MVFRRGQAQDIISEVDGVERWVSNLPIYPESEPEGVEKISIDDVVVRSMQTFSPELARRDVKVVTQLQDTPPLGAGIPAVLSQICVGLIADAFQAMPHGGVLRIRSQTAEDRKSVVISIADNGVGMSQDELARLFIPFRRNRHDSTGIGLPLVRRILESLGGTISVTSQEGKGTTVSLRLPVA